MTTMNTETFEKADAALDEAAKAKRKTRLIMIAGAVLTIGAGYFAYDHFYASKFISTDNAYTAAETASVTPTVGGIVREVRVTDTSYVRQGQVLARLESEVEEAAVAAARSKAENDNPVDSAQAKVEFLHRKFKRMETLRATNTVTEAAYDEAKTDERVAILA